MPKLVWVRGCLESSTDVTPNMTIGRGIDSTIQIDDHAASRCHARLARSVDGWRIDDLDSTNGIRVDGIPVVRSALLVDGSIIQIGTSHFRFERGIWLVPRGGAGGGLGGGGHPGGSDNGDGAAGPAHAAMCLN